MFTIPKSVGDVTPFGVSNLYEIHQAATVHPQIELGLSEMDRCDASATQQLSAVRRADRIVFIALTGPMRSRMAELTA